ncbi:MAG TPA: ATP-binding cassette domain-containing protein [Gemmatimonadales bacterium]|jgi:ABC-type transporter Mla maintaining outer membrane lipid asymmetry ATPase subunit MlaF|nr:ATP-binding cassette domain-containing protein [Gemmatimonadales bacterium]
MTAPLRFDAVPLRHGPFSLTVADHETVVVTGDAASGVDQLGSFALGLQEPGGGAAETLGVAVGALPRRAKLAFRRRVGYLPTGDGLLQNLSLRDNIRLPLRFGSDFRSDEIEGRVDVILAQLRLRAVAAARPAEASAEERRRAALGRALAFDPELVVLEQPFVGLSDRVAGELLEVARGGDTALGGRRTVFITSQEIPAMLRTRVERQVHVGPLPAGAGAA